ncbi:MAG: M55 family metallopeptidase, partial [Pseudomonadota bacterium]
EIRVNDRVASETYLSACVAGHFGVPIIFISGDDVFVQETREILGDFESVITKQSFGTLSANTLTPSKSRKLIQQKVAAAIERIDDFSPCAVNGPVNLQIDFKHRLPAELLNYLPIIERTSAYGIEYQAADILAATSFLEFVTHYQPTLM